MQQDMIVILDLGSKENTRVAREIRELGVYTEIHPHDITAEQLAALPNVKGIILNGGVNRVILRGLVSMSRELGIHTLIEGLENELQLKFVREIGIELVQGFYFHRPEPLSEILYRLEGGDVAIPCETEDERAEYRTSWIERA